MDSSLPPHQREATEQRWATGELWDSPAQLAAILEGIADGITVQDARGRLVYANDAAARLAGYSSAEALLTAPAADVVRGFALADEAGRPVPPDQLPGRLTLRDG